METIAQQKFGVGQPVSRKEDPILVRGQGRYTDDLNLEGQAFAVFLRSPVAHGDIKVVDTRKAKAHPGVLAAYTGEDLVRAGYGEPRCGLPLKNADGTALFAPPRPLMARSRVRHPGEIIAVLVAETETTARDALDLIELEIEQLPAAIEPERALLPEAPAVHEGHGNRCLDWRYGDRDASDRAFAEAAHVSRIKLTNNRVVVASMEPRAAIASFDPDGRRYTLHVGCQGAFGLKEGLVGLLRVEHHQVRVLTGHVGGSFGMKSAAYPEYVPLLHAAKELGRPVKWCDSRSDSFLSDQQGRATVIEGELALDEEGRFLAREWQGHGFRGTGRRRRALCRGAGHGRPDGLLGRRTLVDRLQRRRRHADLVLLPRCRTRNICRVRKWRCSTFSKRCWRRSGSG